MFYILALFVVLSLFWQLENRRRAKRMESHREKQEELTELIMKLKAKENNNETTDHEQGTES